MNLRLLAAASAALIASAAASAALAAAPQATASDSAAINVTVMAPASIAKVTDMAIGTIVRPSTASTTASVTLDPTTGAVTTGAGAQHAGTTSAAKFTVTGPAGTNFTASTALGASDTVKNLPSFAVNAASGNPTAIGAGGTSDLFYGASFNVSDTTAAQAYSGTLTVTINYP